MKNQSANQWINKTTIIMSHLLAYFPAEYQNLISRLKERDSEEQLRNGGHSPLRPAGAEGGGGYDKEVFLIQVRSAQWEHIHKVRVLLGSFWTNYSNILAQWRTTCKRTHARYIPEACPKHVQIISNTRHVLNMSVPCSTHAQCSKQISRTYPLTS